MARAEPVVGVHSTGRGFEGLEDALGPFARLLPVRMRVDGSFAELVRRADAACGAAEEWHELFDFERAGAGQRMNGGADGDPINVKADLAPGPRG